MRGLRRRQLSLSDAHRRLLRAIEQGAALKSHRYLDGEKVYRLHSLSGAPVEVSATLVDDLKQRQLIKSNMKFPVATYTLTEKGVEALAAQGAGAPVASGFDPTP